MLHPPYTAMVLSFVLVGAALAPEYSRAILIQTIVAYLLGLGVGAHFLDQVPGMGSHYVRHWSTRSLWAVGLGALGAAVAIGVTGSFLFGRPWVLPLVLVQGVCAVGYPLAPLFRGALHRDSVFAFSWGALPFLTSYYAQAGRFTIFVWPVAAALGAVAWAEIRWSRRSRRLRAEARTPGPLGANPPATRVERFVRFDRGLQALSTATVVVGTLLLSARLVWGIGG